jgi:transposase
MNRLADTVQGVIGVDTHRDTLAAQPPIESAARWRSSRPRRTSPGPKRPARRTGAKSDASDAIRAAREALACDHLAMPRRRGDREALRVLLATRRSACAAKVAAINQLKALIVGAPEELRAELRGLGTRQQVRCCARLRERPTRSLEHRMTARVLRCTAQRIQLLADEAALLRAELERLVAAIAPWLLELPGVGPISAAQVLVSWSHAGRLRSEAAFAALAGVNPIPASSGQVTRHRLNRGGDRQLNRAPHTIVLARLRDDPSSRAYAARRRSQGKSTRDIRRCLKRAVARQLFKLLEGHDPVVELIRA